MSDEKSYLKFVQLTTFIDVRTTRLLICVQNKVTTIYLIRHLTPDAHNTVRVDMVYISISRNAPPTGDASQ